MTDDGVVIHASDDIRGRNGTGGYGVISALRHVAIYGRNNALLTISTHNIRYYLGCSSEFEYNCLSLALCLRYGTSLDVIEVCFRFASMILA